MTQTLPAAAPPAGAGRPAPATEPDPGPRPGPRGRGGPDPDLDRRVRLRSFSAESLGILLGSAAAALGLTWLVYEQLLPLTGALGFWLVWYVLFLTLHGAVTGLLWGRPAVADRLIAVMMATAGLLIVFVIVDQIAYTAATGHAALQHANFFTQTMAKTGPLDPLTSGGVLHAMVGSLEQMAIATLLSVPLGVLAALFLTEIGGRPARPVRALIQAMTSLPEIIAGLFIYALFILTFGLRQSGFAAGLALTVMMIPFVARGSEVMLRLVPNHLREASFALGASQFRTVWTVVLPTARSGLTTAIVLGMARAIGETAPVLLTSGLNRFMNGNALSGWQTSLPLYIYDAVRQPQAAMIQRGFGAALVLIIVVLVLFTVARMAGGKAPGELTRRQRRQIARDLRSDNLKGAENG
ncbi:MAG TPA: phosphate ABC transporter permease PstA [Actinocrinis sp.]|nr:phosphate ABC transporter permease PstA [Actinocrinis sp.]